MGTTSLAFSSKTVLIFLPLDIEEYTIGWHGNVTADAVGPFPKNFSPHRQLVIIMTDAFSFPSSTPSSWFHSQ